MGLDGYLTVLAAVLVALVPVFCAIGIVAGLISTAATMWSIAKDSRGEPSRLWRGDW